MTEESLSGKTGSLAINLRGKEVSKMLEFVWKEVQSPGRKPDLKKIMSSDEFR